MNDPDRHPTRTARAAGPTLVAAHLDRRRQAMLQAWRRRVDGDPVLADSSKLSRSQFEDHIPEVLDALSRNAVHHTERGGVSVRWQGPDADSPDRWTLQVSDTGPGLENGGASPLAIGLREVTREARQLDGDESTPLQRSDPIALVVPIRPVPAARGPAGEGLGLSIVDRLCELLDASLELRTSAGDGTSFTIRLPVRYDSPSIETPPAPE